MYVGPLKQFELPILLRGGYIDSRRAQLPNVFLTAHGIDDVNGFLARAEAIFYEWQQHTVLIVVTLEKSTDVAPGAKDCSPDSNRSVGFLRIVSLVRRMRHIRPEATLATLGAKVSNDNQVYSVLIVGSLIRLLSRGPLGKLNQSPGESKTRRASLRF
jgi:hypothetical protein